MAPHQPLPRKGRPRLPAPRVRLLVGAAIIVTAGLSVGITALAQSGGTDQPPAPGLIEDAVGQDARWYAEAFGVTQDEAERRIRLEQEVGSIAQGLRETQPDRFAGMWQEHQPEYRIVAWYTGDEDGLLPVLEIAGKSPIPIVIKTGAAHTLRELLAIQGQVGKRFPEAATGIDERGNRVNVALMPGDDNVGRESELAAELQAEYGVGFDVSSQAEMEENQSTYGGKRSTYDNTYAHLECTTGFTVSNSAGATGVLTAAHCANSLTYWESSAQSYATTFVSQLLDATHDAQWSSVVGTEYPYFWSGSGLYPLSGTVSRSTLRLDQAICHYGEGSYFTYGYGRSCGLTSNLGGGLASEGVRSSEPLRRQPFHRRRTGVLVSSLLPP